jgi:hypothetical protein
MGGAVTVWALHLPEGVAWQAWRFAGMAACCTSQKVTTPEFPVTSVLDFHGLRRMGQKQVNHAAVHVGGTPQLPHGVMQIWGHPCLFLVIVLRSLGSGAWFGTRGCNR